MQQHKERMSALRNSKEEIVQYMNEIVPTEEREDEEEEIDEYGKDIIDELEEEEEDEDECGGNYNFGEKAAKASSPKRKKKIMKVKIPQKDNIIITE